MAVDPKVRAEHEARLIALAGEIAALEDALNAKREARDRALREAVDAGCRIDDAGPWGGLTPASARFVLYGKPKREAAKRSKGGSATPE